MNFLKGRPASLNQMMSSKLLVDSAGFPLKLTQMDWVELVKDVSFLEIISLSFHFPPESPGALSTCHTSKKRLFPNYLHSFGHHLCPNPTSNRYAVVNAITTGAFSIIHAE